VHGDEFPSLGLTQERLEGLIGAFLLATAIQQDMQYNMREVFVQQYHDVHTTLRRAPVSKQDENANNQSINFLLKRCHGKVVLTSFIGATRFGFGYPKRRHHRTTSDISDTLYHYRGLPPFTCLPTPRRNASS
jgi:hypothetical protein